jgi:hypothetical protein
MDPKWTMRRILIGVPLLFALFVILMVAAELAASLFPFGGYLAGLLLAIPFVVVLLEEWIWPLKGDP